MNRRVRKTIATVTSTALLSTGAVALSTITAEPAAAAAKPKATTIIRCEKGSSGKAAKHYDGPSASKPYDSRFRPGPRLSAAELSHHTPQGVAWWDNWNGKGDDLLLISAHDKGDKNGHVIALDPRKHNKTVATFSIGPTHAGGLALSKPYVFVDGPKSGKWHTIRTYQLSDLKKLIEAGKKTGKLTAVQKGRKVYGAAFMTADGKKLYSGKYDNKNQKREWMYRYSIKPNGTLKTDRKKNGNGLRWEVPAATQGVAKVGSKFLFAGSKGRDVRANLYVTKASETNLDLARVRCLRAPSMAQGIAVTPGGRVYLNFESGSYEFDGRTGGRAKNVIPGTHTTEARKLTGFTGGTLWLGTLHSKSQEDWLGSDEIAIRVEGDQLGKTISIDEGKRKKINKKIQFSGKAVIKIYEKDSPDGDDYLGKKTLKPGEKKGILSFKRDDAHYRLSYAVK